MTPTSKANNIIKKLTIQVIKIKCDYYRKDETPIRRGSAKSRQTKQNLINIMLEKIPKTNFLVTIYS